MPEGEAMEAKGLERGQQRLSEAGAGSWEAGGDNGGTTRTSVSPPSKTTTSATLKLENQPDCLLYQY